MIRKGFGPRLGAALIDMVIMIVVAGVLGLIFGAGFQVRFGSMSTGAPGDVTPEMLRAIRTATIVSALVGLAYSSMEIFLAATPGKMALKMRITRQDGTAADQGSLIKRWAIKQSPNLVGFIAALVGIAFLSTISSLLSLFILVSCLMTLRATKLALHDDIAGTAVFGPGVEVPGFQVMPPAAAPGSMPPPPPAA